MTQNQHSSDPCWTPPGTRGKGDERVPCNTKDDPSPTTLFPQYTAEQQQTIRENVALIRGAVDRFCEGLAGDVLKSIKALSDVPSLQRRDIIDTYSTCNASCKKLQTQFSQDMIQLRELDPRVDEFCLTLQEGVNKCMTELSNLAQNNNDTWRWSLRSIYLDLSKVLAKDVNELLPVFFQLLPNVMNPTSDNPAKP